MKSIPETSQIQKEELFLVIEEVMFSKKPFYEVIFDNFKKKFAKEDENIEKNSKLLREKTFKEFFKESNPEIGEKLFSNYMKKQNKRTSYVGLIDFPENNQNENNSNAEHNQPPSEYGSLTTREFRKSVENPSNDCQFDHDYLVSSKEVSDLIKDSSLRHLNLLHKTNRNLSISASKEENFEFLEEIVSNPNLSVPKDSTTKEEEEEEEGMLANNIIFKTALEEMKKLEVSFGPRKKLIAIQRAVIEISKTYNFYFRTSFGADELVPILEFIFAHCGVKNLYSHLSFIQNFSDPSLDDQILGEIGYLIVSFEIALSNLITNK